MIYIKYSYKNDPSCWSIYSYQEDEKVERHILSSDGNTETSEWPLSTTTDVEFYKIDYLTEAEVDLIKLEML